MKHAIDTELLNALELFYYAEQFRDAVFVICFDNKTNFDTLMIDLRVLHLSKIKVIAVCSDKRWVESRVTRWNSRGALFKFVSVQGRDVGIEDGVNRAILDGYIPIVSISGVCNEVEQQEAYTQKDLLSSGVSVAELIGAKKLFIISEFAGLEVDDEFLSHPLPEEVKRFLDDTKDINIGRDILSLIYQEQQRTGLEIVILPGKRGALYQEIFTHRGKGTLFTNEYPNIIRQARVSDVDDIMMLMRPYVMEGSVLPVPEDEIEAEIDSYYVYTVNNVVVATARLKGYGSSAELGKFCTLPRYQGRGRARELANHLVGIARDKGYKQLFALSTQPRMWVFFSNLGFDYIDREKLPLEWINKYDFNRQSKAMSLSL